MGGLAWIALAVLVAGEDPKKAAAGLASKDEKKVRGALAELVAAGREGVPHLAAALGDERSWLRAEVAAALSKLGPEAKAALPRLVEHGYQLASTGEATLDYAFFDLGFLAGFAGEIRVAELRRYEPEMNDADRRDADRILEGRVTTLAIARLAREDFAGLLELVAPLSRGSAPNEFSIPRIAAACVLRDALESGGEAAAEQLLPVLQASFGVEEANQRIAALVIASGARGQAPKIAPALAARLTSEDPVERAVAAAVLAYLAPPCDPYGLQLQPLLSDRSTYVRAFAAAALRSTCGDSTEAEDVLVAALEAPESETRAAAIELMSGFQRKPPKRAAEALAKCLEAKEERVILAALAALRDLGPDAKKAGSRVASLAKHKSYRVRRAADQALGRIR